MDRLIQVLIGAWLEVVRGRPLLTLLLIAALYQIVPALVVGATDPLSLKVGIGTFEYEAKPPIYPVLQKSPRN